MVKPLKLTKTVTTGVMIASCITSTLPTHAFAVQANAYADEFQAFVEGVENNKTDDAIADQAEQGTDQAPVEQPGNPSEQTAPAPQTVAPAAPEQAAPQGEPAAPAEDVQASASPSAGVTEAAGKSDVAKKDEVAADKAAGEKDEAAAEVADKAEGVEPAAEIAASEAAPASEADPATETAEDAVENPGDVLGTVKELFPSESFRAALKKYLVFNSDEQELTREHLAKIETIPFDFGAGSFTIGKKDAESLGYMTGLETFSMPGNQMGEGSWKCDDIDALWNSISKMTNLTFLNLSNPNVADNANLKIKMPRLPKLKSLYLEGWTRSIFNGDAYSTKTYEGGSINSGNLPSLIIMRISGTKLDSWDQIGGLSNLQELHISHNGIQDLGFVRNLTKLTSFDAMSNMVTDFSPLKKAHGANLTSLTLINNRKYLVGDQAAVMMGGVDNIEIPVKYILPDGSPMGAGSLSLIAPNDKPAALGAKALPEGVTYDATKGVISITRKAAQNLDEHTVNGHKGKMLAIQFDADHGKGSSATGKVYVEVKVTNEVPNRAPVITAEDITVVQGNTVDLDKHATATDPDNDAVKITHAGEVKWNEPGTYKVTYTATDARGLSSTKEIKVTVKRKLTDLMAAPTIKGAKDIVLVEGDKYEPLKGVTATDSAGKSVAVTVDGDKVDPNKPGTYTITYVATDSNKLTSRKTVKVTVNPRQLDLNAAPTFEGLSDKTIMLGDEFDPKAGVTAKDTEDGTIEFIVKGKVDSTKVGAYELTYTAKDSKGAAVTKVITVTVKQPVVGLNQAPTINAADVTIVQGETFDPMSGVTASDPEDGELKLTVTGTVDTEVYGEYELVYQAIDKDGAKATKTIKVIVLPRIVSLNAVPTIDAHSATIVQGEAFDPMAGVTANDAEDGKLAVKLESGSVDTATPGEYILVYSATDSAGARVTKTITVKVVAKQAEAGKPQKPGKPQQAGKPQKPGKPNGAAQLPQTGDASMVAAGATGLMGVLALAAERLRRRRK